MTGTENVKAGHANDLEPVVVRIFPFRQSCEIHQIVKFKRQELGTGAGRMIEISYASGRAPTVLGGEPVSYRPEHGGGNLCQIAVDMIAHHRVCTHSAFNESVVKQFLAAKTL